MSVTQKLKNISPVVTRNLAITVGVVATAVVVSKALDLVLSRKYDPADMVEEDLTEEAKV
jgi:hypothetical protein